MKYVIGFCNGPNGVAQKMVVGFMDRESVTEECRKRNMALLAEGAVLGRDQWFWAREGEMPTNDKTMVLTCA